MRQLQRNKRLEAYATATASGATAIVTIPLGPSREVKQIAVSVTGSTIIPACSTYVGTNSAGVFISSTLIGDSDTDDTPNITVRSGESLCAVWSGISVDAVCKMTVIYDEVDY